MGLCTAAAAAATAAAAAAATAAAAAAAASRPVHDCVQVHEAVAGLQSRQLRHTQDGSGRRRQHPTAGSFNQQMHVMKTSPVWRRGEPTA